MVSPAMRPPRIPVRSMPMVTCLNIKRISQCCLVLKSHCRDFVRCIEKQDRQKQLNGRELVQKLLKAAF